MASTAECMPGLAILLAPLRAHCTSCCGGDSPIAGITPLLASHQKCRLPASITAKTLMVRSYVTMGCCQVQTALVVEDVSCGCEHVCLHYNARAAALKPDCPWFQNPKLPRPETYAARAVSTGGWEADAVDGNINAAYAHPGVCDALFALCCQLQLTHRLCMVVGWVRRAAAVPVAVQQWY